MTIYAQILPLDPPECAEPERNPNTLREAPVSCSNSVDVQRLASPSCSEVDVAALDEQYSDELRDSSAVGAS